MNSRPLGAAEAIGTGGTSPLRAVMISKAMVVRAYHDKAAAIAAQGVDLTVVAADRWIDSGRSMSLELSQATSGAIRLERDDNAASTFRLEASPIALAGHFHLHWYPGLRSRLQRAAPDVVHVDEEPYNLATAMALRDARRVGARTCFFAWQNLDRWLPPPLGSFERLSYRWSDGAIAGTTAAAEVLSARGYKGPVWVIPQFGVDPDRFRPAADAAQPHPFTVGFVGRLVPEKGVDVLLEALAQLASRLESWRAIVVGDGPARAPLAAAAEAAGIADGVEFRGWVASDELPALYQSLDVLVLPSRTTPRWAEQFGRVLVEAMACGVPCVGTRCGEIADVVGDAGVIVDENDPEQLAAALDALRTDQAERLRLGRLGRERVLANFTTELVARRTVEVYRALMSAPRASR